MFVSKKMKLVGHVLNYMLDYVLDYMLDYMIMDLVTTALQLLLSLTFSISKSLLNANQAAKFLHLLILLTNVFFYLMVKRKS